jgi:hypothetical protein
LPGRDSDTGRYYIEGLEFNRKGASKINTVGGQNIAGEPNPRSASPLATTCQTRATVSCDLVFVFIGSVMPGHSSRIEQSALESLYRRKVRLRGFRPYPNAQTNAGQGSTRIGGNLATFDGVIQRKPGITARSNSPESIC